MPNYSIEDIIEAGCYKIDCIYLDYKRFIATVELKHMILESYYIKNLNKNELIASIGNCTFPGDIRNELLTYINSL